MPPCTKMTADCAITGWHEDERLALLTVMKCVLRVKAVEVAAFHLDDARQDEAVPRRSEAAPFS